MAPAVRVASIGTAVPPIVIEREQLKEQCRRVFGSALPDIESVLSLIDRTGIDRRYVSYEIPHLLSDRPLGRKIEEFSRQSRLLGRQAIESCLAAAGARAEAVDVFVSTSATGVMIPALDAYLVEDLGLRRDVVRLPFTELGCVGGAAGLARCREALLARGGGVGLLLSVEIPSLTFQKSDLSMTNLVGACLFGDGAAAALLTTDPGPGARILATTSWLLPQSTHLMGFDLEETGFHLVLDRRLPDALVGQLRPVVERLLSQRGVAAEQLAFFALHPGGRRVMETVQSELGIQATDTPASWDVLRNYGNMSSPTVLFVLQALIEKWRPRDAELGLLLGFGPGLSTEMSLLQWSEPSASGRAEG